MGNSATSKVIGEGTIKFRSYDGCITTLQGERHVLELRYCWHLKKKRFLLARTMSKLVDIYKRQVIGKLTTSFHPSPRDKEATWTPLIQ